jgi:ubiquinone/menaquinone biosynthesis C-methylase UbiE
MSLAAQTDRAFVGSIPENYDRLLVPLIFEPYANDLAERAATIAPARILETAAGTGVLTRAFARRLGSGVEITATDLNVPMLEHAKRQIPQHSRVQWQQADALSLPFENTKFDLVACQFGVMFFPDRVRGFAEARRVLKRGGAFLFNVWDGISENQFADVVTEALAGVYPADPPLFLARTPHGYSDLAQIRRDLGEAGYSQIDMQTVDAVSRAVSPRDAAVAYCQGTPLRGEIEVRGGLGLERATELATEALAERFGLGPIEGRIRALVITARQ